MKQILLIMALSWPMFVSGTEIYRYVDKNGAVHFSDKPPNSRAVRATPSSGRAMQPEALPIPTKSKNGSSIIRIYKYVDSKGNVHLADHKVDARYKLMYSGNAPDMPFAFDSPSPDSSTGNPGDYDDMIQRIAVQTGLESALIHAMIRVESAYNPSATSPKGAAGLMQLMPATAKRYGVRDRYDPASNVSGGARYLRDLLKDFNNNLRLALAAYNAGEGAVKKYGNKIPPYRETRNYVQKVIKYYQQYRETPPS